MMLHYIIATTVLLLLTANNSGAQDCSKELYNCESTSTTMGKLWDCLKKNFQKFSPPCQEQAKAWMIPFEEERDNCREDYMKFCQHDPDLRTGKFQESPDSQIFLDCVLSKRDNFTSKCQNYLSQVLSPDVFPSAENYTSQKKQYMKQAWTSRKVFVEGAKREVLAEAQEGDVIWYQAKVAKKKIVEQYELPADDCRQGFAPVKSLDGQRIVSCQKPLKCRETAKNYFEPVQEYSSFNPSYGLECVFCYAGGCYDAMTMGTNDPVYLCKVNYKDPAKTPACQIKQK